MRIAGMKTWLVLGLGAGLGCQGSPAGGADPSAQGGVAKGDEAGPLGHIIAPDQALLGRGYGEWSALWWRWMLGIDARKHPLLDVTGADCSVGQSGPLWFLGGSLDAMPKQRNCTVPANTYLFTPIENNECSTMEGNGTTAQQLRDCAKSIADTVTTAIADLDGVPIPEMQDPVHTRYRVTSPIYAFEVPEKSIPGEFFGVMPYPPTGTVSPSAGDGIYLALTPLEPGLHTLHFTGGAPGYTFEVTYHLDVK